MSGGRRAARSSCFPSLYTELYDALADRDGDRARDVLTDENRKSFERFPELERGCPEAVVKVTESQQTLVATGTPRVANVDVDDDRATARAETTRRGRMCSFSGSTATGDW